MLRSSVESRFFHPTFYDKSGQSFGRIFDHFCWITPFALCCPGFIPVLTGLKLQEPP